MHDGKCGQKVPILLTSEMCGEIDELLKTRDAARVVEENPYIFSRPFYSSESHMAKVSRLLLAMEQGNVARFKGMPLANVDVDMESEMSLTYSMQSSNFSDYIH